MMQQDIASRLTPALEGRNVALVGNAESLNHLGLGRDIDACDLVVRLNAAPGFGQASHGLRTDWLASSMFPAGRRLQQLSPSMMLWMSPRRRLLAWAAYGWRRPLLFYPVAWWRLLCTALGARPTTGLMTLDLLTRAGGYSELRLFGFDFFQSRSLSVRSIASPPPHDFAREREFVSGLLSRNRRIRLMGSQMDCR